MTNSKKNEKLKKNQNNSNQFKLKDKTKRVWKKNQKIVREKKQKPKIIVLEPADCELPTQNRPNLLLQLVYFLNNSGTKHVTLGFDSTNDFRLTIILSSNYSFVVMSVVDWFTFLLNIPEVHNFFNNLSQKLSKNENNIKHYT